jgi:RNA polymerase sigma factor (sigma-70 family)
LTIQNLYTENELVTLLKERNNRAFSYLYDNYSVALYGIVRQIIDDSELSNDVLQEVFVNIWRRIETYDPSKGRLFTWMLNIARNASIDTLISRNYQNNQKNQELPDDVNNSSSSLPFTQMNIDHIGLKKILDKLKSEHRTLIELAYFKGYTHEEIAQIENVPLGTVKTRIRNALLQLREYLR